MQETAPRPKISDAALSLVLVARDNSAALADVVAAWKKALQKRKQPFEIIVVESGGSDELGQRLGELAAAVPELKTVRLDSPESLCEKGVRPLPSQGVRPLFRTGSQGFGTALKSGLAAAQYPLLCYCWADGRYDPADLTTMLTAIDKVDLVAGCRQVALAPRWLRVTGLVWRMLMRAALGIPLQPRLCWPGWTGFWRRAFVRWVFAVAVDDPDCALHLCRREVLAQIPIQSRGSFVHAEIIAKANFRGAYLAQVPVSHRSPRNGKDSPANRPETPTWRDIRRVLTNPDFGPADSLHLFSPMH
jgi:glycosyltransferase involved in cell wall biosynthesis